jgi:hypothetical protein
MNHSFWGVAGCSYRAVSYDALAGMLDREVTVQSKRFKAQPMKKQKVEKNIWLRN